MPLVHETGNAGWHTVLNHGDEPTEQPEFAINYSTYIKGLL